MVVLVLTSLASVVMATVAAIGLWGRTVLLDADGSGRLVTRIVDSPTVTTALGEHLGDQLVELYVDNVSFASRVPEALKEEAEALDQTVTDEIRERSLSVASSEAVRAAFSEALVEMHRQASDSLTGEPVDDAVGIRLNLVPAATALFKSLQGSGAWPESPAIPDVDRSAPPEQQVSALEESLGFELPEGLSSVSILDDREDGPKVAEVREWVSSATVLTWVALVVAVIMVGLATLAVRSARARLWVVSILLSVSALSAWLVAGQAPGRVASMVDDATWAAAVEDIVLILVSPLSNASLVVAVSALTAAVVVELVRRRGVRQHRPQGGAG